MRDVGTEVDPGREGEPHKDRPSVGEVRDTTGGDRGLKAGDKGGRDERERLVVEDGGAVNPPGQDTKVA